MHNAIIKCKTCGNPQQFISESVSDLIGHILHGIECADCRFKPREREQDFSWTDMIDRSNPQ